jgi:hypothetical protein
MPYFGWLVTGFLLQRPRFDPSPVHVGSVVEKVALGQVFSKYHVSIIPPVLHTLSFIH